MDWKSIVSAVAPVLGTALGGPLGGMAMKAIATTITGNPSASETEIGEAIANASPEDLVKLKEIEAKFKTDMKNLDIDLEKIAADDRDSARNRQIKTGDWIPSALAILITVAFFGLIGFLAWQPVPLPNKDVLNMLIGVLGTGWAGVVTYYFGSSAGSKQKNNIIENLKQRN